jgi:hypothetical protein
MARTTDTTTWKRGISSRLRRIADTIADDADLLDAVAPELPAPPQLPTLPDDADPDARAAALETLITECYPTVAPKVLALAAHGVGASSDDWIVVARLLYDAHMHRAGGPTDDARLRALVASLAQSLELQARSSARLAGYHETELDNPSTIEGDDPGMLVWEHYLCPPARLARQAIHGESVGNWLSALGELWSASQALVALVEAAAPPDPQGAAVGANGPGEPDTATEPARDPAGEAVVLRAKVALARIEELALW